MILKKILTFIFISVFCTQIAWANKANVLDLEAAFILKFTRYIKWPGPKKDNLKIAVFQDDSFYQTVKKVFNTKKLKNMTTSVEFIESLDNLSADILIVQNLNPQTSEKLAQLSTDGVLVVSMADEAATMGSVINFYVDNGKLRFEINNKKAQANGLKINSRLLKLAKIVE